MRSAFPRARSHVAALLGVLSLSVSSASRPRAQAHAGCAGQPNSGGTLRIPSVAQLQAWTREYYPSLAANAKAPARLVVGFVVDERCRVLRHSVGILPRGGYSEDVVLTLFPGLERSGAPAGVGDAVPPSHHVDGGRYMSKLVVAWLMRSAVPARCSWSMCSSGLSDALAGVAQAAPMYTTDDTVRVSLFYAERLVRAPKPVNYVVFEVLAASSARGVAVDSGPAPWVTRVESTLRAAGFAVSPAPRRVGNDTLLVRMAPPRVDSVRAGRAFYTLLSDQSYCKGTEGATGFHSASIVCDERACRLWYETETGEGLLCGDQLVTRRG